MGKGHIIYVYPLYVFIENTNREKVTHKKHHTCPINTANVKNHLLSYGINSIEIITPARLTISNKYRGT